MTLLWCCALWGRVEATALPAALAFGHHDAQGQQREDLEALLASGASIKVEYKPYDWAVNE